MGARGDVDVGSEPSTVSPSKKTAPSEINAQPRMNQVRSPIILALSAMLVQLPVHLVQATIRIKHPHLVEEDIHSPYSIKFL